MIRRIFVREVSDTDYTNFTFEPMLIGLIHTALKIRQSSIEDSTVFTLK